MGVLADIHALRRAVFERERERVANGLPQTYIASEELAAQLGWDPERFNRVATLLEQGGVVEGEPGIGSVPFETHGLLLTPEGWAQCEQSDEPERDEDSSAQPAHASTQQVSARVNASVALDALAKQALDVVADYFETNSHWIEGRQLRSKLPGTVEEKKLVINKLVPVHLIRDGAYPEDRYRLTLEGALESRHGQDVRQYLEHVLDVLKVKAKRDRTFNEFTVDDIKASSGEIAEAFGERDFKWLDRLLRMAGLCAESYIPDDGGPWRVPGDIEEVLECEDVDALRKLHWGDHQEQGGRLIDPKGKLRLTDEHVETLDVIANYELTNADSTPLAHLLLAEASANERAIRDGVTVLIETGCIEMTGSSGREMLDLTTAGLLASNCAVRADAMIGRLLSYYRDRLATEGVKFQEFTWENLKAAGVATDDTEFGWFVQLGPLLGVVGRSQYGTKPSPHAEWRVPRNVVQLRAATSIADLVVLNSFKPQMTPPAPKHKEASSSKEIVMTSDPKKVFIIHGRNARAATQMVLFLRSVGLDTLTFDDASSACGGSAFVGTIVKYGIERAGAVVALFTPDEHAELRPDLRDNATDKPDDVARWQARPNVLFEAGIALGLDERKTILVTLGSDVKLFSDVDGRHVVRLNNSPDKRDLLRKKLRAAGCPIKEDGDWYSPTTAGDFELVVAATAPSGSRTNATGLSDKDQTMLLENWADGLVASTPGEQKTLRFSAIDEAAGTDIGAAKKWVAEILRQRHGWSAREGDDVILIRWDIPF